MSDSKASSGRQCEKDLIVGRYRIEKKINKSNRGTTYIVTDTKNNNELWVAFVVIFPYQQLPDTDNNQLLFFFFKKKSFQIMWNL